MIFRLKNLYNTNYINNMDQQLILTRTFRFKKIEYARNFDKLLKSANFKYTFRRFKRNDRFGTIVFEFVVDKIN
jgi:hypothetical protein